MKLRAPVIWQAVGFGVLWFFWLIVILFPGDYDAQIRVVPPRAVTLIAMSAALLAMSWASVRGVRERGLGTVMALAPLLLSLTCAMSFFGTRFLALPDYVFALSSTVFGISEGFCFMCFFDLLARLSLREARLVLIGSVTLGALLYLGTSLYAVTSVGFGAFETALALLLVPVFRIARKGSQGLVLPGKSQGASSPIRLSLVRITAIMAVFGMLAGAGMRGFAKDDLIWMSAVISTLSVLFLLLFGLYLNRRSRVSNILFFGQMSVVAATIGLLYYFLRPDDPSVPFVVFAIAYVVFFTVMSVRPGTDTAFLLAVAYVMIEKDYLDQQFLDRYAVGFDAGHLPEDATVQENFKDYVLGAYDGTPKTPEWASRICGAPTADIEWFAATMGKEHDVMFLHSYAAARCNGAENLGQLFLTIGLMGGHMGRSGNSTGCAYYYEAANAGPRLIRMPYPVDGYVPGTVDDVLCGPVQWKSIIEGSYDHMGGMYSVGGSFPKKERRDIDLKMIYSVLNNFTQSRMDINNAVQAHRKMEFVVAQDYKLSLSCQLADIVLPITTE
jgi:hypothetical protein